MHALSILPAIAVAFVTAAAQSEPDGRVDLEVPPAVATITPLPDDLRLVSLPTLQYALRIKPRCAAEMRAESIFVSIADTRKRLDAGDIDGQRQVDMQLVLPQRQIAPIAIENFCRAGSARSSTNRVLRIKDVVTAHLSLRCAGDEHRSIVYTTQPLDVDLTCEVDDADPPPHADQEEPSPSVPR